MSFFKVIEVTNKEYYDELLKDLNRQAAKTDSQGLQQLVNKAIIAMALDMQGIEVPVSCEVGDHMSNGEKQKLSH